MCETLDGHSHGVIEEWKSGGNWWSSLEAGHQFQNGCHWSVFLCLGFTGRSPHRVTKDRSFQRRGHLLPWQQGEATLLPTLTGDTDNTQHCLNPLVVVIHPAPHQPPSKSYTSSRPSNSSRLKKNMSKDICSSAACPGSLKSREIRV